VSDWFSAFPVRSSLEIALMAAGLRRHSGSPAALPPHGFCIYAPPHEALEAWRSRDPLPATPARLLNGYRTLLEAASHHRLVASWRLERLCPEQIAAWAAEEQLSATGVTTAERLLLDFTPLPVSPLTSAVTAIVLQQCPGWLELYRSLEGLAERFGSAADLDYDTRLTNAVAALPLLQQWWQAEATDELTVLQLQQVEEERLTLTHAHQQQRHTLAALQSCVGLLLGLVQRQSALLSRLTCRPL
jgi:hypothetical protein